MRAEDARSFITTMLHPLIIFLAFLPKGIEMSEVSLQCPSAYTSAVTWDYVRTFSLRFEHHSNRAQFCIFCDDYYKSKEKDESTHLCTSVTFSDDQLQLLQKLTPNSKIKSESYVFKCEDDSIKDVLDLTAIAHGQFCYNVGAFTRGNYGVKLKLNEDGQPQADVTDLNFGGHFGYWRLLWCLSLILNIGLIGVLSTIVTSFWYKRTLRDLWQTSMAGPRVVMAKIKANSIFVAARMVSLLDRSAGESRSIEESGDYVAHDVEFRTLSLNTINNTMTQQRISDTSGYTIDGIDVISYTSPKDVINSPTV